MAFVNKTNKAKMIPAMILNHNKPMKKTNSHKVNQNLHRGTKFYSKQKLYDSLQDTFDETCETYLEQNPGMEIAEAKRKTFDELKSNYRQALISNYHDLVQMGNILKKTQSTNK